ncbi:MAG: hypothetical protein LBJ13_01520 [Puniceicoccales bacterium]|jgi:hypothetical protein|nr:hypothetical protein [Puniceicoccales bacterium]
MRVHKSNSGFTILEFLVASGLTVTIATAAILGVNAILDYKKNETTKPKLILEAYNILNEIEKNFDNRCVSMGNLLLREQCYPFQYFPTGGPVTNYPSLVFFVNSADGPQLLCYSMGRLPSVLGGDVTTTSPCGLFKSIKDATSCATIWQAFETVVDLYTEFIGDDGDKVAKLANLISEVVVLFEIHLVRFESDGISLKYLNTDAQLIKINMGLGTLGEDNIDPKDLAFMEITIGTLLKSQHKKYFSLGADERRAFLEKNGERLSRLLPWRI